MARVEVGDGDTQISRERRRWRGRGKRDLHIKEERDSDTAASLSTNIQYEDTGYELASMTLCGGRRAVDCALARCRGDHVVHSKGWNPVRDLYRVGHAADAAQLLENLDEVRSFHDRRRRMDRSSVASGQEDQRMGVYAVRSAQLSVAASSAQ